MGSGQGQLSRLDAKLNELGGHRHGQPGHHRERGLRLVVVAPVEHPVVLQLAEAKRHLDVGWLSRPPASSSSTL